jgi:transposase-like protein
MMKCSKCGHEEVVEVKEDYRFATWLHQEYVVKRRSMESIAKEQGVTPTTINNWLKRFDIRTRGRGVRSGLFDI